MKFKKASIFTTLVIAVLMVYALISLFVVHRQTRQLQDRAATLQQQVSEMTQANAELQYQIDHSEDDDMIESVAREKLGLVKPGEKIFYEKRTVCRWKSEQLWRVPSPVSRSLARL